MIHDIKAWPEYFAPVMRGEKTAELRLDDRHYKVGDTLRLREWDPTTESYTGRECLRKVTHVLHGAGTVGVIAPLRGLGAKFVMLSIREVEHVDAGTST